MALKPCIGCGRLIDRGSRCRGCERPTARERGYDSRWERTREQFLRANPTCEVCNAPATDVHHIDGAGPRGPMGHSWENLMALCHADHSRITATNQARDRRRL